MNLIGATSPKSASVSICSLWAEISCGCARVIHWGYQVFVVSIYINEKSNDEQGMVYSTCIRTDVFGCARACRSPRRHRSGCQQIYPPSGVVTPFGALGATGCGRRQEPVSCSWLRRDRVCTHRAGGADLSVSITPTTV